jgi:hypothetical protein
LNTSLAPNEQASAAIFADPFTPGQILVRGQNLDSATPTYYAASVTRGLDVQLVRVVNGRSTVLGDVRSKEYVNNRWIQVTLTAEGSKLKVQVYRTDHREFLDSHGNWRHGATDALDRTNSTISKGGLVGLAEPGVHAGRVAFDNFRASGTTAGAHGSKFLVEQSFDSTQPGHLPAGW